MVSRSESTKELASALAKAQAEFPAIQKNRTAKVIMKAGGNYSYKYADLSDILSAVTPILSKNGLSLSQSPTMIEGKLALETTLMHSSGEWISGVYPLKSYDRPQEMGSEITYARRYTATSFLGIHADEDDDGALAQQSEKKPLPPAKPRPVAPVDVPPSEFKVTFGKFKGFKLSEVNIHELASYMHYIEAKAEEDAKPITGQVLAFMNAAAAHIETRMPKDSALDGHRAVK